jgi:hypothetical protein
MKNWRRYELLLPLSFNNADRVPKALLAETVQELENRFGAVSSETQIIHGRWQSGGRAFRDDLIRIYVDVEDSQEARDFFNGFKDRAKTRFDQLDIWLISHAIDIL